MLSLLLVACLGLNQGKPTLPAKMMEDYADVLIQGVCIYFFLASYIPPYNNAYNIISLTNNTSQR